MSVEKRLALLKECAVHDRLIIEDDYDNEQDIQKCLRTCTDHNVFGAADRVSLVGHIAADHLAQLVLALWFPDSLLPLYQEKKALYNQTASKSEQLALCQFLRDGHLDSQIRKLKRLYTNKAKMLSTLVKSCGKVSCRAR